MTTTWDEWYASNPACWSWLDPPDGATVDDWFPELCAICGGRSETEDHCHRTGLVRGSLCRSCNRREGRWPAGIYQRYRERPPAVIVGHTHLYDDTAWSNTDCDPLIVAILGQRPTDPREAARYLARSASREVTCQIRRDNNPLKKMGM